MQQSKPQVVFLEDWLRTTTTTPTSTYSAPTPTPTPTPTATSILQAWSHLRDPTILSPDHRPRLLSSLQTLASLPPSSLHVADPQAKLLLSLLSSSSSSLSSPSSSSSSLSSESLSLISRLLYIWLRKSPRPSPHLLHSLSSPPTLSLLVSAPSPFSLLLTAALSSAPALPPSSRSLALSLVTRLLHEHAPSLASLPETLAAIGYALSQSDGPHFTAILGSLLGGIWDAGRGGISPGVHHGLMILRLVEWVVAGFINISALDRIESLCREISGREECARFAVVMAAAGVLRAFRLSTSSSRVRLDTRLKDLVEGVISSVASFVVSGTVGGHHDDMEKHLILQCISLGLVRCGSISFRAPVFLCLCSALLNEILPLPSLFRMAVEKLSENSAALVIGKVKEHLDSVLFKEAGAVTGVFCNQYAMADESHKLVVENYIWQYSQDVYFELRKAVFLIRGKSDELIGHFDKIAEAAFLMVVVFATEVAKHKLNPKSSGQFRPDVAVKILVTFSCIEYLRRVRLPEYSEAISRAVLTIQEDASACALFVNSMPPYAEITNQNGSLSLDGLSYVWWRDEVQTARILFCLRVIPTCISLLPASAFGNLVAPTMFLYMQYPNEKVARASHSVFVAFLSSGKDSEQDDRLDLKEKLVFYYVQRSFEAYPGVTPFEGLASGIAALVRHLPAGSPAIFYCIHSLVEKATELCSRGLIEDPTMWKSWEGSSEPSKKVLDLLLRLIALVDIQVLPYLLKRLAEFVVQLPQEGQNALLDEMHAQVAESDDVTRKPVLVSWLQSLAYLCLQKNSTSSQGGNPRLHAAL